MKSERFEKGAAKVAEYTNSSNKESFTHLKIQEGLKDIAPDVAKFMIEFTYGDVYTRPGLSNKERAMITISSLVTQGTLPQLELHINAGLTAGITPEEIIEIFIQLLSYTGFPKVLNAIEVAKKVFAQKGIKVKVPDIEG